jgi:hypothetical protein
MVGRRFDRRDVLGAVGIHGAGAVAPGGGGGGGGGTAAFVWQPAANINAAMAMSEAKCLGYKIFTIFSFVRSVLKGLKVASASGQEYRKFMQPSISFPGNDARR